MKLKLVSIPWFRLTVIMWSTVWILAAPLLHVHPEADHLHGAEGHLHGGTVHMAWSPDLDCELGHDRHADPMQQTTLDVGNSGAQFAHIGDRHAEFGLSLLRETTNRTSIKPCWASVCGYSSVDDLVAQQYVRIQRSFGAVMPSMPVMRAISSRAPPGLLNYLLS